MKQRTAAELAYELLVINEKRRELESRAEGIKDELADILRQEGVAEMVVPSGDPDYSFHIKTNIRFTKRFDKDGLATTIGRDRDELDYHGITKLVEDGYLSSATVAKFQTDNESRFISVKRKKVPGGKK
jgi:hypothetical protein